MKREVALLAGLLLMGEISRWALSRDVAYKIGKRDDWKCRETGRDFRDGWLLDMAHYDHTRNGSYNNPERGRALCRPAHLREHALMYLKQPTEENRKIIQLLANRNFYEGLRKDWAYERDPSLIEEDRRETVMTLEELGLSADNFIDFEKLSGLDLNQD